MNLSRLVSRARRPRFVWFRRSLFALLVLLGTSLRAQLVTYRVEAHQTHLHSGDRWVDTVVWVFDSPQNVLTNVHVRLIDPEVTLERQRPWDWFYMWALPSWGYHVDSDFLGWHGEFIGCVDPWAPERTAYFGVEFEPNLALTNALLRAEVSYELGPPYPNLRPVPEPATWGWLAGVLLIAAPVLRCRTRRIGA